MGQSRVVEDFREHIASDDPSLGCAEPLTQSAGQPVAITACSLAEAYRLYHDDLVRQAYLLVGSAEEAADLVQDVFVRCHRHWAKVKEPAPYLRRAVVNAAQSYHRRNFVRRRRSDGDPRAAAIQVFVAGDELHDVLAALDYRQRAAIVLRFYADLSEKEIAATLGCRPGTVGSLIHRGLEQLKKVIDQ